MDGLLIILHEHSKMRIQRKRLRDSQDAFDIPENQFVELYRLPKCLCKNLIAEIAPHLKNPSRIDAIPDHILILAALNFFASGSYQRRVGQDFLHALSQSKVSYAIRTIADIISKKLLNKYVKFPRTALELYNAKARFLECFGVPGLIGIIDCTHVALAGLKKELELPHMNRKGFHSKNVQLICAADMTIINMFARYPGSAHDSFIWKNSQVCGFLQQNYEVGDRSTFLFGDSGYPLLPYLITPISNPISNVQRQFNKKHIGTRNLIERTIGVLKVRFRCLIGERKLRYDPITAASIINASAVLHNILIKNKIPVTLEEQREIEHLVEVDDGEDPNFPHTENLYLNGIHMRHRLMMQMFRNI